jgi:uncharacterized protein (DUF305 family)
MGAMIDSSGIAQTLTQDCLASPVHAELTAFCQDAQTYAQQNVQTLQTWLGSWYGNPNYVPQQTPDQATMLAQIKAASSDQVEALILAALIQTNQQELDVANGYEGRQCSDGSKPIEQGVKLIGRRHKVREDYVVCAYGLPIPGRTDPPLTQFTVNLADVLQSQNVQLARWECAWYSDSACQS